MGLDVTLMDGLGCVFALDDYISIRESFIDIAQFVLDVRGDVALCPGIVTPGESLLFKMGSHGVMEQWGIVFHRILDAENRLQHFIVNLN